MDLSQWAMPEWTHDVPGGFRTFNSYGFRGGTSRGMTGSRRQHGEWGGLNRRRPNPVVTDARVSAGKPKAPAGEGVAGHARDASDPLV